MHFKETGFKKKKKSIVKKNTISFSIWGNIARIYWAVIWGRITTTDQSSWKIACKTGIMVSRTLIFPWISWGVPRRAHSQIAPSAVLLITQTGRSGWQASGSCCHPEGPGQAGEMGRQEHHEVQQEELQSPAPGRNNPTHQHMLGATQLESSFAEKGLWGASGHQV